MRFNTVSDDMYNEVQFLVNTQQICTPITFNDGMHEPITTMVDNDLFMYLIVFSYCNVCKLCNKFTSVHQKEILQIFKDSSDGQHFATTL